MPAATPASASATAALKRHKAASGLLAPYEVTLVGAPSWSGQPLSGTELAPAALRAAGVSSVATGLGWRVSDAGDVLFTPPSPTEAGAAPNGDRPD